MNLSKMRKRAIEAAVYYLPSALAILVILIVWHYAVTLLGVKQYILPTPGSALAALFDPKYKWLENAAVSMVAMAGGFVLSAVLGVFLGVVIVWNTMLERVVLPVLILFNTLPKVALAPLFIVWLGYGVWPNIVIATTISFFPIVLNTAAGLRSVEPDLLHLVTTLHG
ncbi:MAG: ABC transporter permease subunit, partial [Ramlibacter sp.]